MRYIALLRGINVGGNTMIKMEELRNTFEALRFSNVATYINSGNLTFDVNEPPAKRVSSPQVSKGKTSEQDIIDQIENAMFERFTKEIAVVVREQNDIARIIAANPFAGEFESHKEMHVLFLK